MGNYQKALELYEKIHVDYPDNLECELTLFHLQSKPIKGLTDAIA